MYQLVLICLFSISCSNITVVVEKDIIVSNNSARIEKELMPYITKFKEECFNYSDIGIRFGILPENIAGYCIKNNLKGNNIIIDEFLWNQYSEHEKEELVFHELGHCILNKAHNDKIIGGTPASIMYPKVISGFIYSRNRDYYIKELCGR